MGPSRLWYDTVDPTINETNIDVFNWWLNTSTSACFINLANTVGFEVWQQLALQNTNITAQNLTIISAGALRTQTTNGTTVLLQAYNTGGASYTTFGTLTAGATPTFTLAPTSITFSGETAFSHYLEQTTFTPTIVGSTVAGAGTYTLQSGYYTRIGNMIFAQLTITWTAHTGTGNLLIGGFPFTCRNSANYTPEGIINTQNMNLPGAANRTAIGSFQPGASQLNTYVAVNAGADSPIQMQASGTIDCTIAYLT